MKVYPHPIKAVIFDNDGLLLDTEGIYAVAHEELTGHYLDWGFRMELMGLTGIDACTKIVAKYGLQETPAEYLARRDARLIQLFPEAKKFPGAEEIINKIRQKKVPIGLATSSNRHNVQYKILHHKEFYEQFDSFICGDDVTHGKPNPEIYLKSMRALGIDDPKSVLVFEDAPNGVRAANEAGMAVIQIPDPGLPLPEADEHAGAHPTLILHSLLEFDPSQFDWEPKVDSMSH